MTVAQSAMAGSDEVAADGAQRSGAPGKQRTDARQEEQEESDGNGDAVIERRAHRNFGALHVFAEDGEERSPQNDEAGGEQDKIIEQETGLAADQRLEVMLALEVVALQNVGEDADREHDAHEDQNHVPMEDCAKAWTELTSPARVSSVPSRVSRKVEKMSQTFQLFIMPFFSCIMTEWRKAVPVSQGMKLAFSTGSHPQ